MPAYCWTRRRWEKRVRRRERAGQLAALSARPGALAKERCPPQKPLSSSRFLFFAFRFTSLSDGVIEMT